MHVTRYTTIPHRNGCSGCLDVATADDGRAVIFCNKCGKAIEPSLAIEDLDQALQELARAEQMCSETCPLCGSVNVFPGMSSISAFTCRHCGTGVVVERPVQ
jgi:predicted RNA-binding Zn-ribbon protein involved in translation (DUF1610 family)